MWKKNEEEKTAEKIPAIKAKAINLNVLNQLKKVAKNRKKVT